MYIALEKNSMVSVGLKFMGGNAPMTFRLCGQKPQLPPCFRRLWEFREYRHSCNSVYHQLHSEGMGANVQLTLPFKDEVEDMLWFHGIPQLHVSPLPTEYCILLYTCREMFLRSGWRGAKERGSLAGFVFKWLWYHYRNSRDVAKMAVLQ